MVLKPVKIVLGALKDKMLKYGLNNPTILKLAKLNKTKLATDTFFRLNSITPTTVQKRVVYNYYNSFQLRKYALEKCKSWFDYEK